jgi:hypothetical protein
VTGRFTSKDSWFGDYNNPPLMELKERLPEVVAKLGEDLIWTNESEVALSKKYGNKPNDLHVDAQSCR